MGALPKIRISRTRRNRRRAHYLRLKRKNLTTCSNCGKLKPPHIVCPSCGHFRGVKVFETEKKKAE